MVSETTILFLQSIAAIFMAADYFFTEKQRDPINAAIQRTLAPMNQQIDTDIRLRMQSVTQNLVSLIVSALFLLLSWFILKILLPVVGGVVTPWVIFLLALLVLGLVAGATPALLTVIITYLLPILMAASMGTILKFLIRCPKGTIFGIGFLFLAASLFCRWLNV